MAAVVAEKLARQLRGRAAPIERADAADRAQLFTDLDALLPAAPEHRRTCGRSCDEGWRGGGAAVVCRLIEALYASRADARRPSFDAALGRVRADAAGPHRPADGVRRMTRDERRRSRTASATTSPSSCPAPPTCGWRACSASPSAGRTRPGCSTPTGTTATAARPQGFCLRRDPGNALLRELSDLGAAVPGPASASSRHRGADADAVLLRGRPGRSSARRSSSWRRCRGTCPSPWGRDGRRFYEEAAGRGVLPASFTDALAALHTLDWQAAGLDFLGVPAAGTGFARRRDREVAGADRRDRARARPDPDRPDLLAGGQRARARDRLALVHGAYRTGNLLIDDDRVSAVLDWETAGHRRPDVRRRLRAVRPEPRGHRPARRTSSTRDDFYRRYEAGTGIEIDDDVCRYYQLLYAMRSAAFWMSASDLYASGPQRRPPPGPHGSGRSPSCSSGPARDLGY